MTWSGFRPSDDACTYGYLVPANQFAVVVLGYLVKIIETFYCYKSDLLLKIKILKTEIENGIEKYAIIDTTDFGEVNAYEVEGLDNYLIMDDANVPSLLSLPYLGYCDKNNPRYLNTRRLILSKANPYFYSGKEATGIGSPHTPPDYVWPISLAIQGLNKRL